MFGAKVTGCYVWIDRAGRGISSDKGGGLPGAGVVDDGRSLGRKRLLARGYEVCISFKKAIFVRQTLAKSAGFCDRLLYRAKPFKSSVCHLPMLD